MFVFMLRVDSWTAHAFRGALQGRQSPSCTAHHRPAAAPTISSITSTISALTILVSGVAQQSIGALQAGAVGLTSTALVAEAFERSLVLEDGRIAHDGPTAVLLSDSDLLAQFGLTRPPATSLSMALDLPERPIRIDDVAKALAARLAPRYLDDSNA